MKFIIFYSWQSDLPNNTNRGFIETVIEKAIKAIQKNDFIEIEPCLERDTKNIPGSPNIILTILEKIKKSDVFIADISIVTGDKEKGQKLSPNPNVLIELGFAINCLGWENIILFFNKAYESTTELPFDIRQHRRIEYYLLPENPKSRIREELAKLVRSNLIEIINTRKNKINTKFPEISVDWYIKNISDEKFNDKDVLEDKIKVHKPSSDVNKIIRLIEKSLVDIGHIDGADDPDWQKKVKKYRAECENFLEYIQLERLCNNFLFDINNDLIKIVEFSINNIGTIPVTDVNINIEFPQELIIYDKYPSKNDIPKLPKMPVVVKPRSRTLLDTLNLISDIVVQNTFSSLKPMHNKGYGISLADNILTLWIDKLLHKNTINFIDEPIFLLAKPNAKSGIYELPCDLFCEQYDDWKEQKILLEIV